MIATISPLKRQIKLAIAMLVIALAAGLATQVVWPQQANAKSKQTYVIDGPIGKGLLAHPSKLSEGPESSYDGTFGFKDLTWTDWGKPTATANGTWFWNYTGDRIPVTVTLTKPTRCGPYRIYTKMQITYHAVPGTPTELPNRKMVNKIDKRCVLTVVDDGGMAAKKPSTFRGKNLELGELLWTKWSQRHASARGYVEPYDWFDTNAPPLDRIRDYAAIAKFSRPRYCRRSGTIAYTRVKVSVYGKGIPNKTSTVKKHRRLRAQAGRGKARHVTGGKSIQHSCARAYYEYAGVG